MIRRLRAGDARCRRHRPLHATGAGSDDRRDGQPHPVPVRAGGRQSRMSSRPGFRNCSSGCSNCPSSRMSRPTTLRTGFQPIFRSTAPPPAASASPRRRSTTRSMTRSASASSRRSSPSRTSTGSSSKPIPELQQSLSSLGQIYLPSSTATQRPGAAVGDRQVEEQTAPLAINHLGQFPSATDLVQSGARRLARRGGRCDQAGRAGTRHAGQHDHRLPGRGAGLPGRARQRARC